MTIELLVYDAIERLVVQGEEVACRIRFDCTPAATFRGIPPAGRGVPFNGPVALDAVLALGGLHAPHPAPGAAPQGRGSGP
ncbi:ester cyclase [Streptomyces sp. NPDC094472]|uniref:ester cyclase n=1 Tax=unclassified Streptomyces TaxID=2593676 RepID=UPI00332722B7